LGLYNTALSNVDKNVNCIGLLPPTTTHNKYQQNQLNLSSFSILLFRVLANSRIGTVFNYLRLGIKHIVCILNDMFIAYYEKI